MSAVDGVLVFVTLVAAVSAVVVFFDDVVEGLLVLHRWSRSAARWVARLIWRV